MERILKYYDFINESYEFKNTTRDLYDTAVSYTFTNRDNIEFRVIFELKDYTWCRVYGIVGAKQFRELDKPDAINVVKTVTEITIDFINRYDPKIILIEHIPSESEKDDELYRPSDENKRTRVHRRFLLRLLPKNYKYSNEGPSSMITRIED
jgi:hypothetical protein